MLLGRKALGTVAFMGGVPAVLTEFCWAWGQMVQWNEECLGDHKHYVHYDRATYSDHAPARNSLANSFLGQFLLQMDCDHAFEPDIVTRMVRIADEFELDVLTAVYQMKRPPHVALLYTFPAESDVQYPLLSPIAAWPQWVSEDKSDGPVDDPVPIIQIGSAGAGCLFVRRKVFDAIAEQFKCGPFDRVGPYSEDHSFFWRCRELGIKCYAAMDVHSEHLRITGVKHEDLDNSTMSISAPFAVEGFR